MMDFNYIMNGERRQKHIKTRPIIYHPQTTNSSPGWQRYKWRRDNVLKGIVPNLPGIYMFFNEFNSLLYIGHASRLRHRLQSYYQDDCFSEHPTKKKLRNKIDTFAFKVMRLNDAMAYERIIKHKAKFNYR